MTDALYLGDPHRVAAATVGSTFLLDGDEGRHAATVKRARPGETLVVADGNGSGVRVRVQEAAGAHLTAEVIEVLTARDEGPRWRVVQALAKGERSELSVELLTEVGVHELVAWQSQRSIVKWDAKAAKGLAKWQATAREAAKQSRRLLVPRVHDDLLTTRTLIAHLQETGGLVLVAHEEATRWVEDVDLPSSGPVTVLVGPEGGISPEELDLLTAVGAVPVLVGDTVLRSSTAGAVTLAQLKLLARRGRSDG